MEIEEALSRQTSPHEVLALRPSPQLSQRTEFLLAKSRDQGFTPEEKVEWDEIMRMEHLVRIAKAKAALEPKNARVDQIGAEHKNTHR